MTFEKMNLSEPVCRALREKNYSEPTPIQQQAIPEALEGRDLLGLAQTGTGKTAAFALPIIEQLQKYFIGHKMKFRKQISALILTPTRELAIQIDESLADYTKYTDIKHTVIFGGVGQQPQIDTIRKGCDILTATPGRLIDLMNQGFIHLDDIRHFVLDEADRMLDMGFIHDIRRILPKLPAEKQTLFFSATMPDSIDKLSKSLLHRPARVEVTPASSVVDTIKQCYYKVEKPQKKQLLEILLKEETGRQVLVFSRTKHGADNISKYLKRRDIACESIHGDKSQGARQKALNNFKSGVSNVIIATDIAARGIDIKALDLVINYDLPDVPETYVHRIGRTGRAGCSGSAITFCSIEEQPMLREVEKLAGIRIPQFYHDLPPMEELAPISEQEQNTSRSNNQNRNQARNSGPRQRQNNNNNNNSNSQGQKQGQKQGQSRNQSRSQNHDHGSKQAAPSRRSRFEDQGNRRG